MADEVCQSVSWSFACGLIVARLVLDTQRSAGFGFAWCFGTPGRLGLRCSRAFGVWFPVSDLFLFPSSLRIIDAVFGVKDIRLSAGDDQLFSQHRPLSYLSDGVGSLRRGQGFLSTDRLHIVSLSTKQLVFETRTQRRRRQTSPDGSRKAGHDSQHLQVALATGRNEDGNCEDASATVLLKYVMTGTGTERKRGLSVRKAWVVCSSMVFFFF
jgi:hypothetical protein